MPTRGNGLLTTTLVMAAIALALVGVGYFRGGREHVEGLRIALGTTGRMLPLLLCAFVVAGMMQVLVPREFIAAWLGPGTGLKGILLGSLVGSLTPGGPYVSLPVAAGLVKSGASLGASVGFLTGWAVWSVHRLPMEFGILGWKLTVVRVACCALFPPVAGLLAHAASRYIKL
ncbi:MAG: permease [Candidatus Poribacteria bacterium]